jgi:hypothetical protein
MSDANKKSILVTGSHLSGSTWTGRMLSLSPSVAYIHEPFNLHHRPGICKAKFNYWFPYMESEKKNSLFPSLFICPLPSALCLPEYLF